MQNANSSFDSDLNSDAEMEIELAQMEAPDFAEGNHFQSFEIEKPEDTGSSQGGNSLFQNKIKNNTEFDSENQTEKSPSPSQPENNIEILTEEHDLVREEGLQIPSEEQNRVNIAHTFGKLGELKSGCLGQGEDLQSIRSINRNLGSGGGSFGKIQNLENREDSKEYEIEVTDQQEAEEFPTKLSFGETSFQNNADQGPSEEEVGQGVFGSDSFANDEERLKGSIVMANQDLLSMGQMSRPNSMQSGLKIR